MSSAHDPGDAETLRQLCAHFGIATEFDDIWGARHQVAHESLLALLAEFDVPIDDPVHIQDWLATVRRAAWTQALPPVIVIPAMAPSWDLLLHLPVSVIRIGWHIRAEDGSLYEGVTDAQALPEMSRAEQNGVTWCERRLSLTQCLPMGYHHVSIDGWPDESLLVCAPAHCYRPPGVQEGERVWGPAVQLYALRSRRNWGIGDFGDLALLVEHMAQQGADLIGLNPLHALLAPQAQQISPYSPSSRLQLNVLYIDVERVADFADCEPAQQRVRSPEFQARLANLRASPLVDHAGVAAAKFEVLELLFAHFQAQHLTQEAGAGADEAARSFFAFVAQGGEDLYQHALFEALQAHFYMADPAIRGWPLWPSAYQDPGSTEVRHFAQQHAARVQYHQYLQWLAAHQLGEVSALCRMRGMGVGLYVDLAVSVDRTGADAWRWASCFAATASVGAPPDDFNQRGQCWGLQPLRPDRLRASHYRYVIDTLRANMRCAGALRMDHVMGLMRLFWIPAGQAATAGAYVHYPVDELLAIVALESQRNACMVVGEDLGTVTEAMRAALARFGLLSYRLLYFERLPGGDFKPARDYPANAVVAVSTHDLATLAGWWVAQDLHLRLHLGLDPDPLQFERQLLVRTQDRVRLLLAVQQDGLLSVDALAQASVQAVLPTTTVEAIHAFLAQTPCALMMVQLEDVLGVVDQVNLPGTVNEHPNWRRKMPLDLQALATHEAMLSLSRLLARLRPRRGRPRLPPAHAQTKVPRATYRLQLHKNFGFDAATRILPYLAQLGVSHVYCSPIQRARAGSLHGYDVVAHDQVNPELGGQAGLDRFAAALRAHGMGLLLDVVPNHMSVLGVENAWWMDVLENGPASLFAQHFDIDWLPLNPELTGKVLLPVLEDHYGDVLVSGKVVLRFDEHAGNLSLHYFEHRFPLAPESYARVLMSAQARLLDVDLSALLASAATAFSHLPGRELTDGEARTERARDKELLKARLARLVARQPSVAQAIVASVAELNLPQARDELHALIEAQAYRLAYWRVAADEINYRRFFDINDLAALRMEREDVFESTQGLALDLAAAGVVDGLRIDHPDGLYDPARYFAQLQEGYARRAGLMMPDKMADGRPACLLYVVAEKIVAPHEEVPLGWHIHGTTGYNFANMVNGVLVDTSASAKFGKLWRNFTGLEPRFDKVAHEGKLDIMRTTLSSELNVLSTELLRIARADRRTRDYTHNALRRALAEITACLPVYRTYIIDKPSAQDLRYVDWATRLAEHNSQDADLSIFSFVRRTLLGQSVPGACESVCQRVLRFAVRFQQFSAPVAAKGVEDTAFYRYFPLSSLNEVGGDPAFFGIGVADFHKACALLAKHWPNTLLASSTHDNKRSEDVRNRLHVLSEMPATWRLSLRRWRELNRPVRDRLEAAGAPADIPSSADEYLLYQTLLGTLPPDTSDTLDAPAWALYVERLVQYLRKSAREAKLYTRWTNPNEASEAALEAFVRALLASVGSSPFGAQLQALAARLARFGGFNSLSLTLLKLSAPGVPDLYQGQEVIRLSLVDPDNRRPVDYDALAQRLASLQSLAPPQVAALLAAPHDGNAKLWLTWRLLTLRQAQPELFRRGGYTALRVVGARAEHVLAFARQLDGVTLVVIAARFFARLLGDSSQPPLGEAVWIDTAVKLDLPEGTPLSSALCGETLRVRHGQIAVGAAFTCLPVAALMTKV